MRLLQVVLAAAIVTAQIAEEPTIRITVTNVLLDVAVTDRKGNPITDLKPGDFRITQNGKPRTVESASFHSLPRRIAAGPGTGSVGVKPSSPGATGSEGPAAARTEPRTIAFVVDDLGLSMQSMQSVREGIRRFIDRQLLPTDRVAIVRTGGGISALQQFTTDANLLRVAAARLRFNPVARVNLEQGLRVHDAMEDAIQQSESRIMENSIVGAMGTLKLVIDSVSNAPGRKSVFLFTDGLPVLQKSNRPRPARNTDGETLYDYEHNPRAMNAIRGLSDAAARGGVVVHTVDAKGLLSTGIDMTLTGGSSGRNPQAMTGPIATRSLRLENALDGLKIVARQTGGIFTTNNNDLNSAIVESVNADASYYVLAYAPDPSIFQAPATAFHNIKVTVARPGLEVRYRAGFYGRADSRESMAALAAPPPGVNLTLSPAYFQTAEGPVIDAQLLVDAADLTFTTEADGTHKTVMETNLVTLNEQGVAENQLGQDYTLRVKPEQLAEIRRVGLVYRVRHPVKRPGAFLLRAVVTDKASRRTGSATHFVEVPDIRKKSLVISNLTIGRGEETANRAFKAGDTLDYGAQIINNTTRALKREVRLYWEGDLVGHFPLAAFEPITVESVSFPVAAGRLQLGPQAAAGMYTLELSVVDPGLKGDKGRATQFARFTVIAR